MLATTKFIILIIDCLSGLKCYSKLSKIVVCDNDPSEERLMEWFGFNEKLLKSNFTQFVSLENNSEDESLISSEKKKLVPTVSSLLRLWFLPGIVFHWCSEPIYCHYLWQHENWYSRLQLSLIYTPTILKYSEAFTLKIYDESVLLGREVIEKAFTSRCMYDVYTYCVYAFEKCVKSTTSKIVEELWLSAIYPTSQSMISSAKIYLCRSSHFRMNFYSSHHFLRRPLHPVRF